MVIRISFVAMLMPLSLLMGTDSTKPVPPKRGPAPVLALGRFGPYAAGRPAVTYDAQLVPVGALAAVASMPSGDRQTIVLLQVRGLVAGRKYGAHVHTGRCGVKGDDAGPHYQNKPDPVTPSTNPRYANPRNEIWLDFTTDAYGGATSRSTVNWRFTDRHARSVVIHAEHTHTDPGHAGQAGARLACINVDFVT